MRKHMEVHLIVLLGLLFDRNGAPETVDLKGKGACMSGDMHGDSWVRHGSIRGVLRSGTPEIPGRCPGIQER